MHHLFFQPKITHVLLLITNNIIVIIYYNRRLLVQLLISCLSSRNMHKRVSAGAPVSLGIEQHA